MDVVGASDRDPLTGRRLRGLSWDKKNALWRVRIYYAGKLRFVGKFPDAIEAAKAYDKAAGFLYGSTAITNFGLERLPDASEVGACIVEAKNQTSGPVHQHGTMASASHQHWQQQQQQQPPPPPPPPLPQQLQPMLPQPCDVTSLQEDSAASAMSVMDCVPSSSSFSCPGPFMQVQQRWQQSSGISSCERALQRNSSSMSSVHNLRSSSSVSSSSYSATMSQQQQLLLAAQQQPQQQQQQQQLLLQEEGPSHLFISSTAPHTPDACGRVATSADMPLQLQLQGDERHQLALLAVGDVAPQQGFSPAGPLGMPDCSPQAVAAFAGQAQLLQPMLPSGQQLAPQIQQAQLLRQQLQQQQVSQQQQQQQQQLPLQLLLQQQQQQLQLMQPAPCLGGQQQPQGLQLMAQLSQQTPHIQEAAAGLQASAADAAGSLALQQHHLLQLQLLEQQQMQQMQQQQQQLLQQQFIQQQQQQHQVMQHPQSPLLSFTQGAASSLPLMLLPR